MILRNVDLNLLVAFDALMAERHVSRAAARIGLSQPAMSNALARLRELFQDELLVRQGGTMRPSPRALEMVGPVREALNLVQVALTPSESFDPAATERVFNLSFTDYMASMLLPPLLATVQRHAPGVALRMHHYDRQRVSGLLQSGAVDLAAGNLAVLPANLRRRIIQREDFVCATCRGNPLVSAEMSIETYAALDHIMISRDGSATSRVDMFLAERGLTRRVALTVPNFMIIPRVLPGTRLVATFAKRVARRWEDATLRLFDLPVPLESFENHLVWDARRDGDPALMWLRDLIADVAAEV